MREPSDSAPGACAATEELPRAFLYSGQGGQTYHMARAIYEGHARFRIAMDRLDEMARRRMGSSVLARLFDNGRSKADPFDDIRYSHPAIFMVELALSHVLIERFGNPDYLLGASLGETTAATIAGSLGVEAALDQVCSDAEALHRSDVQGGMLAILADSGLYERDDEIAGNCQIASIVDDTHFVVAGRDDELARVEDVLSRRQIGFMRLPVRYPFHSNRIGVLRKEWLDGSHMGDPRIPLVSCAVRDFVRRYDGEHMRRMLREPLQIARSLAFLADRGPMTFIDLGPGSGFAAVLLRRKMAPAARVLRVLTPYGNELGNFRKVEAALAANVAGTSVA